MCCVVLSCSFLLAAQGASRGKGEMASMEQIRSTIANVRAAPSQDERREAAQHLATLVKSAGVKHFPEKLVTDITSLLDSSDDTVRYWVATAIGNIGPDAKSAIPRLKKMLPAADCINGAITSASGIRYALTRLGVKHLRSKICPRIAG